MEEVSCGVPFIYVPLSSRAAVDAAEPDLRAMRALRSAFPGGHNAVFLFAVEPYGSDVTVYSRMFAPDLGVAEDAATGSASGPLGCYLVTHRLVHESAWNGMVSLQGVKMGRPSRIHMRITADSPTDITRVQVGGQAVKVGSGVIDCSRAPASPWSTPSPCSCRAVDRAGGWGDPARTPRARA